jgi:hypothetical protein
MSNEKINTVQSPVPQRTSFAEVSLLARKFMKPNNDFEGSARNQTSLSIYNSPKKPVNSKKLIVSKTVLPYAASILHENRTVHYKKGKQLGDGFFIVEMSSTECVLYITAVNIERAESLILEI